jgi:hypothetical protein
MGLNLVAVLGLVHHSHAAHAQDLLQQEPTLENMQFLAVRIIGKDIGGRRAAAIGGWIGWITYLRRVIPRWRWPRARHITGWWLTRWWRLAAGIDAGLIAVAKHGPIRRIRRSRFVSLVRHATIFILGPVIVGIFHTRLVGIRLIDFLTNAFDDNHRNIVGSIVK